MEFSTYATLSGSTQELPYLDISHESMSEKTWEFTMAAMAFTLFFIFNTDAHEEIKFVWVQQSSILVYGVDQTPPSPLPSKFLKKIAG